MTYQTTSSPLTSEPLLNQGQIHHVSNLLCDKLGNLLEDLEVDCKKSRKRFSGCCPVHGGDNTQAFRIFPDGYQQRGYWQCFTRTCHLNFKSTVIGFVRGVLSHKKFGWRKPNDREVGFNVTLKYILDFLKIKDVSTIESIDTSKSKFIAQTNTFVEDYKSRKFLDASYVRQQLIIPSKYYMERGFSSDLLYQYDIGDCLNPGKPWYERSIIPCYDAERRMCCGTSRYFGKEDRPKFLDFGDTKSHLFNYSEAIPHITRNHTVFLVEGAADALKMIEAGFPNVVALWGTEFTEPQQIVLEKSPIREMVVLLDSDEAGYRGMEQIKKDCGRLYSLHFPTLSAKEPADCTVEQLQKDLRSYK